MDDITRTREEIAKTLNEAAAQVRDMMVEAHVAATLTAPLLREGMSAKGVVERYREVLAELRIHGPYLA